MKDKILKLDKEDCSMIDHIDLAVGVIKNSNDANLRWQAAQILGRSNDSRAIDPLINALDDEDPFVPCHVMIALQCHDVKDERIIKKIRRLASQRQEDYVKLIAQGTLRLLNA